MQAPDTYPAAPQRLAETVKELNWMDVTKIPRAVDVVIEERQAIRSEAATEIDSDAYFNVVNGRAGDANGLGARMMAGGDIRGMAKAPHVADGGRKSTRGERVAKVYGDNYFNTKAAGAEELKVRVPADDEIRGTVNVLHVIDEEKMAKMDSDVYLNAVDEKVADIDDPRAVNSGR